MRAIVTIVLLFVMAGMVFASLTADAPAAGVDYAVKAVEPKPSKAIDAPGDRLMVGLTSESPQPALMDDETGPRSGNLLFHLKSLLQEF